MLPEKQNQIVVVGRHIASPPFTLIVSEEKESYLFKHKLFDHYSFEEIPLNCDIYLVDECFMADYDKSMLGFFSGDEYKVVGYVSYVAARKINERSLELSWYTNVHDRFHEVMIILPRNQFVGCVGSWQCDEKPRIFVKSAWLESIHLRSYSIFALIDAIGVKYALECGDITREKLIDLRSRIDDLSSRHPDISFISFADSLLLKSNWSVGHYRSGVKYSYRPEVFIHLASEIDFIYQAVLGLRTYAVVAQGSNEYYDDPLLHVSDRRNHISLNSLGIPFAQLQEIELAARKAIRTKVHLPADLYMDEQFYHSLKYKYKFDKNAGPSNTYQTKMIASSPSYYYSSLENILSNLEIPK